VKVNRWENEDEDDDDVPEAWDAEPEKVEKKPTVKPNPKKLSKAKIAARQRQMEEEDRRRKERMTKNEKYAAKLRQQKLVEEADKRLADDLLNEKGAQNSTKKIKSNRS
jgi:hypothetical protein